MANLPYIQALSLVTQNILLADTPQVAILEIVDDINEFSLDTATGVITYEKHGAARKFAYVALPQVGRKNECQSFVPNFRCWLQKKSGRSGEFGDIPNSNVLININTLRETKDVLTLSGLITLKFGDKIRVMIASNITDEIKIESIPMTGEPNVPSITISMFNIGLEKDEQIEPSLTKPKKEVK